MKEKLRLIVPIFVLLILAAAFILPPLPAATLYIRIYFDDIQGSECALYYALDGTNAFSQEQCIISAIDPGRKMVEFALEPSLENRISGLRLDFPDIEQLLCIKTITVSNAGIIRKQYDPCRFFAPENILFQNDIDAISLATAKTRTYMQTASGDPYLIFSDGLCRQLGSSYSHFRLTRFGICLFLLTSFFLAHRKLFREDSL